MNLRHFLLALGASLLVACAVQPAELPAASPQTTIEPAASAGQTSTGEVSTSAASSELTTRCDDNACFEACTMTGACDGFCISNQCTCVGTQGPPCS